MESLIHADIFFFITTIFTIALGILFIVGGIYAIVILRDLKHVARMVKDESVELARDVQNIREGIRKNGSVMKAGLGLISMLMGRHARAKNRKKTAKSDTTENNQAGETSEI